MTEQKNRIMTDEQTLSMQGYVTRDLDGKLSLFLNRPIRNIYGWWQSSKFREREHVLSESAFPALTWDDEPIEVEVTIKPHLTSDAEGEYNPQTRAWEALTPAMRTYCRNMRRTSHDGNVEDLLDRLFGPKCPPGGNSSNVGEIGKDCNVDSSEPKFKRCEKVITPSGKLCIIEDTHFENSSWLYLVDDPAQWVSESDLEPYTEPEEEASPNVNHSDINIDELVAKGCIPNPAKQFDNILKDSFQNERRLNIATQIISAILSNQMMLNNLAHGETTAEGVVKCIVNTTMMYTDALIAECEQTEKLKEN